MEDRGGQEYIGLKSLQDMWSDIWTTLVSIGSTAYTLYLFSFLIMRKEEINMYELRLMTQALLGILIIVGIYIFVSKGFIFGAAIIFVTGFLVMLEWVKEWIREYLGA